MWKLRFDKLLFCTYLHHYASAPYWVLNQTSAFTTLQTSLFIPFNQVTWEQKPPPLCRKIVCLSVSFFAPPRSPYFSSLKQSKTPSILTFSNLEEAAYPVRSPHKWRRQSPLIILPQRGESQSQQCQKEHKSLMSVFVISLANGTADPTGLKQPAQHFESTLYQRLEARRTTASSGFKERIQQPARQCVR